MEARVYSYSRFSDVNQRKGTSIQRQHDLAIEWAKREGMELDTELTMRDEGLSAFHQDHLKKGALGVFLSAVKNGKIPPGSILVLEAWDRFSRAEPLEALEVLKDIVQRDVAVVISTEGKKYTKHNLAEHNILLAVIGMSIAHRESAQKSRRVKHSIIKRAEEWVSGVYRGPIRAGTDPSWVRWDGEKFVLIDERANAIKHVIQMYINGYGYSKILKSLDESGLRKHIGKGTLGSTSHLYRIILSELVIGTKNLSIKLTDEEGVQTSKDFKLENYYPPLITREEYALLLTHGERRTRTPSFPNGKSLHPPILTGMGITFCGYCDAPVVTQNLVRNRREKKEESRRVRCNNYSKSGGLCVTKCSCNAEPIEIALLNYCSDQFNLNSIFENNQQHDAKRDNLSEIKEKIISNTAKLNKIIAATLEEEKIPKAMLQMANAIEEEITALSKAEVTLLREIQLHSNDTHAKNEQSWREIANDVLNLNDEARMRCRKLIADTFSRITIFFQGIRYNESSKVIHVALTSKSGVIRHITVLKKDGRWVSGFELNTINH